MMLEFYDIITKQFHKLSSINDSELMLLNEIESTIRQKFQPPSPHHSLVVTNLNRNKFHNIYQLSPFLATSNLIDQGLVTFFYSDDLPPFFDNSETLMTSDQLDVTSFIHFNVEGCDQFHSK